MRLLFILLSCSFLAACMYDPSYMPIGYKKAREEYKSPDGANYRELGYEYSAQKNEEILRQWEAAVSQLVDAAAARGLIHKQGVVMAEPMRENAFQYTLDHVMRQELRSRGYALIEDPQQVEIYVYAEPKEMQIYMRDQGGWAEKGNEHGPVILTIALGEGEYFRERIQQEHDLPLYGAGDYSFPAYGNYFSKTKAARSYN